MNDFTKEELEMINQALRGYVCDFECYKLYCSAKEKIQSMIDNYCEHGNVNFGHLTDKHIDQWARYLLEELPNYEQLIQDDGLAKIFIRMYKKGFQDCKTVGGTQCHDNQ